VGYQGGEGGHIPKSRGRLAAAEKYEEGLLPWELFGPGMVGEFLNLNDFFHRGREGFLSRVREWDLVGKVFNRHREMIMVSDKIIESSLTEMYARLSGVRMYL